MIFTAVSHFLISAVKFLVLPAVLITGNNSAPIQGRSVAGGDLLVAPGRVLLADSLRTVDVNLLNIGTRSATYRISLIHQRMDPDGALQQIEAPGPGELFADELIRFTPRQVVLEPNVSQLVRIQLRLPAEIDAGEYRSHILFRAIPEVPGTDVTPIVGSIPDPSSNGISMQLAPIYGISIPLIVRHGKTSVVVGMRDLKLTTGLNGSQSVTGQLTRSGNQSAYGDIQILYVPKSGTSQEIGKLSGVAIYSPNPDRNFAVRLALPAGLKLQGGTIKVFYRHPSSDGGKSIAEGSLGVS